MTVKYGEMENLVSPIISVDQYKPKIGEVNETVVVSFRVAEEQPARDLSNLLETGVTETLDVDISQGPDDNGDYYVFLEFERNNELFKKIIEIVEVASNVTGINEWKYTYFKGDSEVELSEENLANTVIADKNEYVLKFVDSTNEDLERVKKLAGLTHE